MLSCIPVCRRPLRDGKVRQLPLSERPKRQHDPTFRHTGVQQLLRDAALGAVALNPELAVDKIDMHQAPVFATNSLPADDHQQIVVLVAVEDGLLLISINRFPSGAEA